MKLKKYFTVLPLIATNFNVQALNLSTDLNKLSPELLEKYLDEASQILEVYPIESFSKVTVGNEIIANKRKRRSVEKTSRVKRSYNVFAIDNCQKLDSSKMNRCLRIYGTCGQYVEILRSKLITYNPARLTFEDVKEENTLEYASRSIDGNFIPLGDQDKSQSSKISKNQQILENLTKKVEALKAKTEMIRQQSENLKATVMMRASENLEQFESGQMVQGLRDFEDVINDESYNDELSAEDLLHVIDDNPTIVEVYHSITEAKEAHRSAKLNNAISLGLDVNEMIHRKNEHSVCSTIRLKIWSRFCEPCVEQIDDENESLMVEAQSYEYDVSK